MKRFLLFCWGLLALSNTMGQSIERQVIGTGGEATIGPDIQLEWTMGETAIASLSTDFGMMTEGFIQPSGLPVAQSESTATLMLLANDHLRLTAFPNPVYDQLTLQLAHPITTSAYYQIVSLTGQILLQDEVVPGQAQAIIDMSALPTGLYLIRFLVPQMKINHSFKILKSSW